MLQCSTSIYFVLKSLRNDVCALKMHLYGVEIRYFAQSTTSLSMYSTYKAIY